MEEEKKIESKDEKKIKNLISATILLGGLFIGSLFVDVAQLVRGSGFSERNLSKSEIIESHGKTWVAFGEAKIDVKVISDETCEKCDPSEPLVWLRRVAPTISAQKIDVSSEEGKSLIKKFVLKTLPAFIFSDSVTKTEFYSQAQVLFTESEGLYILNTQELGLVPGKYVELPKINDKNATFGNKESDVNMIVFSDFQCPYCKVLWGATRDIMKEYEDRILVGFKNLPLDFHPQANNAALAAGCALDQNKFWEYGDKLFATQNEWSADKEVLKFKEYASVLELDMVKFNQCFDGKEYQGEIDKDKAEAESFNISGTPATFINSQFRNGVVSADDIRALIDSELEK